MFYILLSEQAKFIKPTLEIFVLGYFYTHSMRIRVRQNPGYMVGFFL